jgi:molecular chaperone DnaJ
MQAKRATHYEILGLQADVSNLEIKRAYRRLVKRCHPDIGHLERTLTEISRANEHMMRVNEAYETLKDKGRRAEYDSLIGLNGRSATTVPGKMMDPTDSDAAREQYLRQAFHPARHNISKLLNRYKKELLDLSQDLYNDQLVEEFANYVDQVEDGLSKAAQLLSSMIIPKSLRPAELMMRYAIAQAADGLEELKRFCQNYDYDHLSMAGNLFREYTDLSKKALQLSKH